MRDGYDNKNGGAAYPHAVARLTAKCRAHNRRGDFRLWPCSATADDSSLIRVKDQRNPLPILIVLIASRLAHRRNDEPPSPFR